MVRCRKCNRPLTNPVSIELGIGVVCRSKTGFVKSRQTPDDGDIIVEYDGGNFWIERMEAMTETFVQGFGTVVESKKHSASGCRTNVPRQIYRHSPTGYNFGYAGSGLADWVLNICLLLLHADDAYTIYQTFKSKFVAVGDSDRLEIKRTDAEQFLIENNLKPISLN